MSPLRDFKVFPAILRLPLSTTQRLLLCLILTFTDEGLKMSNEAIGQALNVSSHTIRNSLTGLRQRGLIETEKARSRYRKIYPHKQNLLDLLRSQVKESTRPSGKSSRKILLDLSLGTLLDLPGGTQKKRTKRKEEERISSVDFMDLWNSHENLPKIHTFTPQRKKALAKCSREPDFADHWKEIIDKLSRSSFHTGQNKRGWKATVDWLLKDGNYVKILELEDSQAEPDYSVALRQYTHDATEEEAEELMKEVLV